MTSNRIEELSLVKSIVSKYRKKIVPAEIGFLTKVNYSSRLVLPNRIANLLQPDGQIHFHVLRITVGHGV